jgi:hypothetical protein
LDAKQKSSDEELTPTLKLGTNNKEKHVSFVVAISDTTPNSSNSAPHLFESDPNRFKSDPNLFDYR